ncbi:MAG: PTS system mannose/fructose/sorbose family transporter subunit IID [Candidatus Cryosericum sp.]
MVNTNEVAQQPKKVARRDVIKAFWNWFFFAQSSYNYERLQGMGVACYMAPILNKLYTKKEDIAAGLKRQMAFFNTEPSFGCLIHGVNIAMEEQKANGAPIGDEEINSLKTGLMGPMAGLGDSIIQGVITPILLAIGIGLAQKGSLVGPALFFVLETVAIVAISFAGWMQGYTRGREGITDLLKSGVLRKVLEYAGILGCGVLGALAAQFVSLSTPISMVSGTTTLKLQDMLDKVLPGLLPLALTLVVFYFVRKGKNANAILVALIIAGIVGALLKIF